MLYTCNQDYFVPINCTTTHLACRGIKYAHDFKEGFVEQEYLPEQLSGKKFYRPAGHGYEKYINERMEFLRKKNTKD